MGKALPKPRFVQPSLAPYPAGVLSRIAGTGSFQYLAQEYALELV